MEEKQKLRASKQIDPILGLLRSSCSIYKKKVDPARKIQRHATSTFQSLPKKNLKLSNYNLYLQQQRLGLSDPKSEFSFFFLNKKTLNDTQKHRLKHDGNFSWVKNQNLTYLFKFFIRGLFFTEERKGVRLITTFPTDPFFSSSCRWLLSSCKRRRRRRRGEIHNC